MINDILKKVVSVSLFKNTEIAYSRISSSLIALKY